MRATRADQRATRQAVVGHAHLAAIRTAEQVAWQRLNVVAPWGSGTPAYRGALDGWRATRYALDRALVPVPPPGALPRRRAAHHGGRPRGARAPERG
jgi:hypothetical protein